MMFIVAFDRDMRRDGTSVCRFTMIIFGTDEAYETKTSGTILIITVGGLEGVVVLPDYYCIKVIARPACLTLSLVQPN